MSQSTEEQDPAQSRGRPEGLPKRWRARRKAEVVRLLRAEEIGEVSREVRVAPPELERWRRGFLDGGQQGAEEEERAGRGADAVPSEAGRDDDARLRYPVSDPSPANRCSVSSRCSFTTW